MFDVIFLVVLFLLGFFCGAFLMWCYYARLTKMLTALDDKYNRLVTLMSEWQKKL